MNPLKPAVEDIAIEDIARALANQCRFAGHCRFFYSVAQHSVLVLDVMRSRTQDRSSLLWALLHDAPEAYLGDLSYPIKRFSEFGRLYRVAERSLQTAICRRFQLPPRPPRLLHEVDRSVLAAERRVLMAELWPWPQLRDVPPAEVEIAPLYPDEARTEFMRRYSAINDSPLTGGSPLA